MLKFQIKVVQEQARKPERQKKLIHSYKNYNTG